LDKSKGWAPQKLRPGQFKSVEWTSDYEYFYCGMALLLGRINGSLQVLMIVSSAFAHQHVAHSYGLAAICELIAYPTDAAYGSTIIVWATGTTISAVPHCSPLHPNCRCHCDGICLFGVVASNIFGHVRC
jgi:hypothetical protein